MSHPVAFFEIVSNDAPRLQRFYTDLFGWSIETDEDGYGLVDTIARAQELGSSVHLEPMELPGGFGTIAVVSDPDGNPVGLWA